MPINAYIYKKEKSHQLNIPLQKIRKEQTKGKASRRKDIIKIEVEINKTEQKNNRENQQNKKLGF